MSGPRPQAQIRWDNDLGIVRLCRVCDEWWPADPEFFYLERRGPRSIARCRACRALRTRASNTRLAERRRDAVRIRRTAQRPVLIGPTPCHDCGDPLTWDGKRWNDRRGKHRCAQQVAA